MKNYLRFLGVITLLLVGTSPVWAEVELRSDLGVGQREMEWPYGYRQVFERDTDLEGWMLGVGVAEQNFRLDFDYIHADLDEPMTGADDNTLRDLRIGYRFYESNGFGLLALGSYIDDRCGQFRAKGPAFGVGVEYALNRKWSIDGRLEYSATGVKVKNGPVKYEDAAMFPVAVGLKYQISDNWSFHTGYRHYGFLGEVRNRDLTTNLDLVSAGISYRFGAGTKAKPKETAASGSETKTKPKETAAPGSGTKTKPKETAAPGSETKTKPKETAPPSPDADSQHERQEKVNRFLRPIFFDVNSDQLRPDQVHGLEKNLKLLNANADLNIVVAGHADQSGSAGYNQKLSLRRAERVKSWLVKHGIREGRIFVYAYGKENPYQDKARRHRWESDRWVDIYVTDAKPTRETGLRK